MTSVGLGSLSDRIVRVRMWPIVSAAVLGLASMPRVAAAIVDATTPNLRQSYYTFPPPLDPGQAMPIALLAVLAAGLVGGGVGGAVVRRSPVAGLVLAVLTAWAVAIATLPILPTLWGEPFAAGFMCIDGCSAEIRGGEPLSGIVAYAQSVPLGAVEILPPVLALILGLAARFVLKHKRRGLAALLGIAAVASLNFWSVLEGSMAFLCLAIGAVIWVAPYWYRIEARGPIADSPAVSQPARKWMKGSGPSWGRPGSPLATKRATWTPESGPAWGEPASVRPWQPDTGPTPDNSLEDGPSIAVVAPTQDGELPPARGSMGRQAIRLGRRAAVVVYLIGAFWLFLGGTVAGVISPVSATGSMTTPRTDHTATLLGDGQVLIAGGDGDQSVGIVALASAELYDPRIGTFSPTGSMATARMFHSATRLADGRVIIAGGADEVGGSLNPLVSAEVFDPRSGAFNATGRMTTARVGPTATLLSDGRVLITGGYQIHNSVGTPVSSAELYDPGTGEFNATGSMATARFHQTATLLDDGRVLVVGGADIAGGGMTALPSAEIYDPRTARFSRTGSMATARAGHTATLLPDGHVLIAGGDLRHPTAELYDPRSGTFSPTGSMTTVRYYQTATLRVDGHVLVIGGDDYQDGASSPLLTAETYDPATGTFSPTGSLITPRASHTATLLADGHVLITGGQRSSKLSPGSVVGSAEVFR